MTKCDVCLIIITNVSIIKYVRFLKQAENQHCFDATRNYTDSMSVCYLSGL